MMEVLLESFADLNLNKSSARFCTCTPVQLFVACRCLCCLICWSLIKHHTSLFCLVEYSASLVLSSLTASRKAPSWDSWVSVGSSDLHGHMCPQLLFLFVFFHINGHVFSSKPPSSGRDLYPTNLLLASTSNIFLTSFHLSFLLLSNSPHCSTTLDLL